MLRVLPADSRLAITNLGVSLLSKKLSHYEILDLLGAGGMGEVYRAEDTVLGREVALKVLLDAFVQDRERLARFEREAKVLATLDHPNIASIYAFEEDQGVHFLVMQMAPGETLAERIARGPIPLMEALPIASQIAQGLEAAHEKGIIHRDLKPANIKIDAQDQVKILDFGLAKALDPRTSDPSFGPTEVLLSESPTLTAEMTQEGVILGTAAYMSPEQARGKPLDRRVDVWAFGCVLYEMLTGQKAFEGETVTDYLAKILEREPEWEALPEETPAEIRTVLRRCLAKDPRYRLHDMGDVWLELREVPREAVEEPGTSPRPARWTRLVPWALAAAALGVALWSLSRTKAGPAMTSPARLPLATQQLAIGAHPVSPIIALSRDGSLLAYVAGEEDRGKIVVRRLDSFKEQTVVESEGAQAPFFSPDGRWIGFAADGSLKISPVDGGQIRTLAEVAVMHGATWGTDDTIIFSDAKGLSRVSANGGEPERVTEEETESRGEIGHHSPELIPGEDAVTFVATGPSAEPLEVALVDLTTGERSTLIEGGGIARVLASGHLVYTTDGRLYVVRFNLGERKVVGDPVPVVPDLMMGFPREPSLGHFSVADTGTLVYVSGPARAGGSRWVWVDRANGRRRQGEMQKQITGARFSPDGTRIAVSAERWGERGSYLWIEDLERGTLSRLTFEQEAFWPLWSPSADKIAFSSWDGARDTVNIFQIAADGSGSSERLTRGELWRQSGSFSVDGARLIFHRSLHPETGWDVVETAVDGAGGERALLESRFNEFQPSLSPDGRWLAYVSNETGRNEVYVRRYPDLLDKWQISNQGGIEPAWSPRGDELFYRTDRVVMRVVIDPEDLSPGKPEELFEGDYEGDLSYGRTYDVAPDNQGFLFLEQPSIQETEFELRIVLDWVKDLESHFASNES